MSTKARMLFLLMVAAIFSVSLQAQGPGKQSWENLNRLQVGQKIQLVQMNMKSMKGKFLSVSEDAISLRVKKNDGTVPREDVMRVTLKEKSKRGRNALFGAAIGAGIGAGLAVVPAKRCANIGGILCSGIVAGLVAIPIGIGAGVGAAIPSYPTMYRAKRKKPGKVR